MKNHILVIPRKHIYAMQAHVNAEAPLEACGLLGGNGEDVKVVLPVKNAAESRVRYQMEPRAQLRAFEQIENEGMELLAIFHSHPRGPSHPSPSDIAEAAYPVIYVILSRVGRRWQTRAFWIEDGHAAEVPIAIAEG